MSRAGITPISSAIRAARQKDARHYGVHPYFTRRPPNVVREYVKTYSHEGDVVLDPFGGTGVTAIEAMLLGRRAIHNDLNPFANFMVRTMGDTTLPSTAPLCEAFARVGRSCASSLREIEEEPSAPQRWLQRLPLPENIELPRTSDARRYYDMFTPRQLAGLALLKQAIEGESEGVVRDLLLLAWSASLAKLNRTFLSANGRAPSRGGSSIFSIYRYKLAAQPVELPIWDTFCGRYQNVLAAKEEVRRLCRYARLRSQGSRVIDSRRDLRLLQQDAATLDETLGREGVDYIFTDPPYGANISYLDLSMLWNHWLGFPVADQTRDLETIVGGERGLSEEHYKDSLARSIRTCFRCLRPDRWCSIVFQHWELGYFATILETADECGADLKAAITQTGDVIWSMHKKKNSASVLGGEMIITFYKPAQAARKGRPAKRRAAFDAAAVLGEALDACLEDGETTFTSETLFNRLVIELWRRRALGCLRLDRRDFADYLKQRGWAYDARSHLWSRAGATGLAAGQRRLFEA